MATTTRHATVPLPDAPRRAWTVSQVVRAADRAIQERTGPLWVRGEVSGWSRSKAGHCYFTLKDERAEICCTLWSRDARRLPLLPEDGMEVDALGQLGIYARKGEFRLQVSRVETTGAGGIWQEARERLLRTLRAEGLLDEARKRPLPPVPGRVGIVTSARSAALHDMHRVLRRRAWWTPVLVSDCGVEGVEAAPEVAAAIRRFGRSAADCPVDVVIVARGGGSMESLWAFNTEAVARAIAECPVPVVSAVGHETDYTVADMVADHRAATPTAGAEHAVPDGREIARRLLEFPAEGRARLERAADREAERLRAQAAAADRAVERRLALLGSATAAAEQAIEAHSPRRALARAEERLERAERELPALLLRRLATLDAALAGQAEALDARSPLRVLARGYALAADRDTGRVLRSHADAAPGQALRVRLGSGTLDARVEAVHPPAEPRKEEAPE